MTNERKAPTLALIDAEAITEIRDRLKSIEEAIKTVLPAEKMITLEELADQLRFSKVRTYQLASRGLIPSRRLGQKYQFLQTEIDAWIKAGGLHATAKKKTGPKPKSKT